MTVLFSCLPPTDVLNKMVPVQKAASAQPQRPSAFAADLALVYLGWKRCSHSNTLRHSEKEHFPAPAREQKQLEQLLVPLCLSVLFRSSKILQPGNSP